jgi:hypothetical protein
VTIWTSEGRSTQGGFPEKEHALQELAPAAVFQVLVSGGFLFVFGCIFLSLITVYNNSSYFKLGFLALWVENLFLTFSNHSYSLWALLLFSDGRL